MTPSKIVHAVHGAPKIEICEPGFGHCYVCGGSVDRGLPIKKWMGSNYTDQTRVRSPLATHTCESCVFVHSRTSPVLGRPPKEGKRFGGNFRNYSHMHEEGWKSPAFGEGGPKRLGYVNASKGEKPLIREFLQREHRGVWFAAIADSGQKHVLPFAPMNGPCSGGRVIFDEMLVSIPSNMSLLSDVIEALSWGLTKDELSGGAYRSWSWMYQREAIETFERSHGSERGGEWFALAIWLGQRDEEKHAARQAAAKGKRC